MGQVYPCPVPLECPRGEAQKSHGKEINASQKQNPDMHKATERVLRNVWFIWGKVIGVNHEPSLRG